MKRSYHAIDVNFTRQSLGIYFFPLFLFFLSIDAIHSSKFQCVTNLSIKKKVNLIGISFYYPRFTKQMFLKHSDSNFTVITWLITRSVHENIFHYARGQNAKFRYAIKLCDLCREREKRERNLIITDRDSYKLSMNLLLIVRNTKRDTIRMTEGNHHPIEIVFFIIFPTMFIN